MIATSSDQDWVRALTCTALMQNCITVLLSYAHTQVTFSLVPNGPLVIPPGGGQLLMTAHVTNPGNMTMPIDAWAFVELPNGIQLTRLVRIGLNLPPG